MSLSPAEPDRVLTLYSNALERLRSELDQEALEESVNLIQNCPGMTILTGMGKAGLIGQKISATLASTGSPSLFLHPSEAFHGDLGRVRRDDVVVALSNSGNTNEIVRLINPLKRVGASLIAITGRVDSPLGQHADVVLSLGGFEEACPIGLAPTTSTLLMLAMGDLLAIITMGRRRFSKEEFALFHPGGQLGRKLLTVGEVMRSGDENPLVPKNSSVGEALVVMTQTIGRPGAVNVIEEDGTLAGVFTDGDLRRHTTDAIQSDNFALFREPIAKVMTRTPRTMLSNQLASEALRILRENRIDQIPVVDNENRPVGLLDVQDLLDIGVA